MRRKPLQNVLTQPRSTGLTVHVVFWFSLSLTIAAIYSGLALREAFSHAYIVQDDARQHVFWMQRFIDGELFPHDLIADYFQSVAPVGYTAIYRIAAAFGIHPFLFNKLLPPILGAIATGYCFGISLQLLPVPAAGFITTVLLNQSLWMKDDLISATPRAFVYPLFLAFLYYLLRQSLLPCLATIILLSLFYPQYLLIFAALFTLQLLTKKNSLIRTSAPLCAYLCAPLRFPKKLKQHPHYLSFLCLILTIIAISGYALIPGKFDPVITATQAKQLPEFWGTGRSYFFSNNPWYFFFLSPRSGLLDVGFVRPATLALGILLPILCRYPNSFPLVKSISPQIRILTQIVWASILMFILAHLLLFNLHLPSRYTEHSFRLILSLSAGMVLTIVLDAILRTDFYPPKLNSLILGQGRFSDSRVKRNNNVETRPYSKLRIYHYLTISFITAALLFYPYLVKPFPLTKYKEGHFPALYQFFQQQPKDSLIASVSEETDNLPTFAQRSILVGREYAIPYHWGYYRQFRQRTIDLIKAQYSSDLEEVKQFIQRYGVDFWLLDNTAFTPEYLANHDWLRDYQPVTLEAQKRLTQGITPALTGVVEDCSVFQMERFVVLQTTCISKF
ncbi:hypothetical protein MC7420_7433 [Coleofasciculus chthonoplastes PCC 7420]|uniref:Glycosyltransferase RgtA/B/C/D-like domain-containing protein n=1 Tax=Coleofasciculus chthonoplastes PCC 7420 TaxID=118168 RepID=B4VH23_9CYAN|nr:hypothetical protein [Coleofasciculus chthonoplastes]EDX78780.1 hypothetical protein MC7420_7433 [Coleofasciculus chthonoplastes PCC 7420]